MTNSRRSIVRTIGVGTLVVAALMTFLPGSALGSVWTYRPPFLQLDHLGGQLSEAAFRANQLPLVLATGHDVTPARYDDDGTNRR